MKPDNKNSSPLKFLTKPSTHIRLKTRVLTYAPNLEKSTQQQKRMTIINFSSHTPQKPQFSVILNNSPSPLTNTTSYHGAAFQKDAPQPKHLWNHPKECAKFSNTPTKLEIILNPVESTAVMIDEVLMLPETTIIIWAMFSITQASALIKLAQSRVYSN